MIHRTHNRDLTTLARACYSDCERYRYSLTIQWDRKLPNVMVIGLNPSTATEKSNDPTITRLERYAQRNGFGSLEMYNAYAYRATNPKEMLAQTDPNGPENDATLRIAALYADTIIFAWGNHCDPDREQAIWQLVQNLDNEPPRCWGLTQSDRPKHPLYLKDEILDAPVLWVRNLARKDA